MAVKKKPSTPAKKKPVKPAPKPKQEVVTASTPSPEPAGKAPRGIMKEIAVADPRFGLNAFGFFTQIRYNPDDLVGKKGLRIYSEMRRDEQVKAALTTKKNATIASGWEIVIDDKERVDDEQLDTIKRFIEFNLNEMEGTVEGYLTDAMSALDFGYSITEPVYKLIDYGEFDGLIGFKALKVRRPEQIDFEIDQFGNLTENGVVQATNRLPASRFAIYSYRKEFGNLYGNSDLREAHRAWFAKDVLVKFMGMALERYGQPIAVATAAQTMSDDEKSELLKILQNIQARTGIIVPDWITIEFPTPTPRTAEAFIPALNKLDEWIAMAILMPSLLGMGGGKNDVGSNARSQTEFDTFLFNIEQLRKDLQENLINERIVKVLVDLNYDVEDGFYPKFRFKELTHERKIEILDQYVKLMTGQLLTKTTEDEEFARSLLGAPELPEDTVSAGTREAAEQQMKDQVDMAGKMAKAAPAVPPAPATQDKVPGRNPFQPQAKQFAHNYYSPDQPRDEDGKWSDSGGGKTLPETLAQVGRAQAAMKQRVHTDLSRHPDGYQIKSGKQVWTKQTIAGDVFWKDKKEKKWLTGDQLLEHLGRAAIEPHVSKADILDWNVENYAQRDDLPRRPGTNLFAGRDDAPRDFDEAELGNMIKRGQALGYDEETLNFAAGFMSAPASQYQSLNEMAARGKALGLDQRTLEYAMGFLGESLDAEKRAKAKDYHLPGQHDQEDHGNRGGELGELAIKKGGFTYNSVRIKNRKAPSNGFAVAFDKSTEKAFSANEGRKKLKERIVEYVNAHRAMIKEKGNYLGGWYDKETGKVFLDISKVLPDKKAAIDLAKKAKQIAIFDLGKMESIDVQPELRKAA